MTDTTTCSHPTCPQCGMERHRVSAASTWSGTRPPDPLWLPLAALVCGLLSVAALLTGLQTIAAGALMVAAVAIGCIAVARQERGQALAMAGVALGAVGLMGTALTVHLF